MQARFGKPGRETHAALKSAIALFHFWPCWQSRNKSACSLFFKACPTTIFHDLFFKEASMYSHFLKGKRKVHVKCNTPSYLRIHLFHIHFVSKKEFQHILVQGRRGPIHSSLPLSMLFINSAFRCTEIKLLIFSTQACYREVT